MELADERATRQRRVNAGSRLQELLEQGLGDEEEEVLRAFSDASSDTSFTSDSSEELTDEVESDFSDEEVAGVLEGEIVETEESVWREERRERREAKNKLLARSRHFTERLANANKAKELISRSKEHKHSERHKQHKQHHHKHELSKHNKLEEQDYVHEESTSSDNDSVSSDSDDSNSEMQEEHDLRSAFRQRPAPTIPLADRMQAALERAARVREAMRMQSSERDIMETGGNVDAVNNNNDSISKNNVVHGEKWSRAANLGQTMDYAHGFNMGKQSVKRRRKKVFTGHDMSAVKYNGEMENGKRMNAQQEGKNNANLLLELQNRRVKAYTGTMPYQKVLYCSGQSILATYGVPTIISFSHDLPPVLQSSNSQH